MNNYQTTHYIHLSHVIYRAYVHQWLTVLSPTLMVKGVGLTQLWTPDASSCSSCIVFENSLSVHSEAICIIVWVEAPQTHSGLSTSPHLYICWAHLYHMPSSQAIQSNPLLFRQRKGWKGRSRQRKRWVNRHWVFLHIPRSFQIA